MAAEEFQGKKASAKKVKAANERGRKVNLPNVPSMTMEEPKTASINLLIEGLSKESTSAVQKKLRNANS